MTTPGFSKQPIKHGSPQDALRKVREAYASTSGSQLTRPSRRKGEAVI